MDSIQLRQTQVCGPPHQGKHNQGSFCKWECVAWFLKTQYFQHQMSEFVWFIYALGLANHLHLI